MLNHHPQADILEIFSSVQGEGPFTGVRQVFIRFDACNMECVYCDVERKTPAKKFSADKLLSIVKQLYYEKGGHHSVSLTGGEPLLYKGFLGYFLPLLKNSKFKTYLDTNGTLPDELSQLIDFIDIVSMDIKLPSATGSTERWEKHKAFLNIAKTKTCFIKAVITDNTTEEDILKAISLIEAVDKELLLVLQPVWPGEKEKKVKTTTLFDYLFLAEKKLKNVRIMPQAHKLLGVK